MNEPLKLALAGLAGGGLGALFFGGLWWTVRKGVSANQPALWFLGSLLLRTAIAVAGIYVVSGGRLGRLLACLAGFTLARLVVTSLTRPSGSAPTRPSREAGHAP